LMGISKFINLDALVFLFSIFFNYQCNYPVKTVRKLGG
jgi:hypothetical protein